MGPDTPLSVNSVLKVAVGGVLLPVCNVKPLNTQLILESTYSETDPPY